MAYMYVSSYKPSATKTLSQANKNQECCAWYDKRKISFYQSVKN